MESASPSPEPRHVRPGSLMKWDPWRRVWNPGLRGALSEDGGPARSPVHPATPAAPPSISGTSSASGSSVAPLVWRPHVAALGPESSGRELPPYQQVPALLVSPLRMSGGLGSAVPAFSCHRRVVSSLGSAIPVDDRPCQPRGPASPGAVFSDVRTLCSPRSA